MPDDAAGLYRLPLDQFTTARNELAVRLRKAGQREDAEAVKRLPKPSLTAWALDQVASREPKGIARLLAAGEALRAAQQGLLAGRDPAAFREAVKEQQVVIAALTKAAVTVLEDSGHPANKATLDRLEATLRAAAANPEGGEKLGQGVLAADLDPTGFGGLEAAFGAMPIPFPTERARAPARETKAAPARATPAADGEHERFERLQAAREVVARRKRELETLRKQAADAEREAAAARQAAVKTDRAVSAAQDTLARAEREAGIAHRVRDDAAQALADLREHIDQTGAELAGAEDALKQARN